VGEDEGEGMSFYIKSFKPPPLAPPTTSWGGEYDKTETGVATQPPRGEEFKNENGLFTTTTG
jgi:hypothetical protein